MKPKKQLLTMCSILLITALLAACGSPAAAPTATPAPPQATAIPPTPMPIPPTPEPTTVAAIEATAATEPHGLRPDAPPYAVHGPYTVGARDFSVQDGDHALEVTVWYPALNPTNAQETITYVISDQNPNAPSLPIEGRAIQDAAPDSAQGPYPLVVFSPGLSGWRPANSYVLEHLASHGFVVMASDPRGETFEEFWLGAATRPVDTNRLIAYADELTATDGALAGLIDTEHIAVSGHSSGGWTALVGGGAQMDWGWCEANPDIVAQNEMSNCTQFVPHQEEIAALLGLDAVPTGMWPPLNDPRVDAVVAMAPDGDIWGANYEGVAALKVPTLIMAGSGDTVNIPERCAYPIYEHLGSAKKSLIAFANADHMLFSNQCRDSMWMVPDLFFWCSDAVWDMDRAHDLINHFTTAFLLAELKGDAEAAKALAPDNVDFPGITYETTAYGAAHATKLDDATASKIETLVEEIMASGQVPGAAVGIVKDGELVYAKGFGVTELGGDEPVTTDTVFVMASVAKSPVGMAVMQLVEAGKIDLDAPVTEYLSDFTMADPDGGAVTIRQLLSHTSGMPDPVDRLAEYQDENTRTDEAALGDYVRTLSDDSLTFRPGEEWSYSDTGFDILGDVVAAVSGQTFEDYMQANILTPLGMKDSSYLLSDLDPAQLAAPQMYDENDNAKTLDFYPYSRAHAPSGAFYSSVNDMARLAIANLNQGTLAGTQVLPASAYDEMWAPQAATTWAEAFGRQVANYGLGWFVGEFNGHPLIGNYGTEYGFQSHLGLFPDDDMAVIALVNLFDPEAGSFYAYDIGNGVAQALLGVEAEPATQP